MDLVLQPLDARLGAVITGADLSKPWDERIWQRILKAWHSHVIVLFPVSC